MCLQMQHYWEIAGTFPLPTLPFPETQAPFRGECVSYVCSKYQQLRKLVKAGFG